MMRLPRPASPRTLWRDLRAVVGQRSPHQLVAATLALAIPIGIGIVFTMDSIDAHDVGPRIIYVESWPADRSLEETRAKQASDQILRERAAAENRRQFQRLDDGLTNLGL